MTSKKKMGRPPASWMFELVDLELDGPWTDAYEVADHLGVNAKTVKSFFEKLDIKPKHEVENGKVRARFKIAELRRAAGAYVKPWL